ncbi:MAG: thioesterase family protein [Betaproteobacteria bacterium]|nr:thioesterase family protein [Betaproteobacteria bacterium]
MPRLALEFPPEQFFYATQLSVRSTDVNAGQHLGNDALISMLSEARSLFFYAHGFEEVPADGLSWIITDLAAIYRNEAFARDVLRFDIGLMDFNRYGGDVIYRVSRPSDGALIALAKNGFVFFDYFGKKVVPMPETFSRRFPQVNRLD